MKTKNSRKIFTSMLAILVVIGVSGISTAMNPIEEEKSGKIRNWNEFGNSVSKNLESDDWESIQLSDEQLEFLYKYIEENTRGDDTEESKNILGEVITNNGTIYRERVEELAKKLYEDIDERKCSAETSVEPVVEVNRLTEKEVQKLKKESKLDESTSGTYNISPTGIISSTTYTPENKNDYNPDYDSSNSWGGGDLVHDYDHGAQKESGSVQVYAESGPGAGNGYAKAMQYVYFKSEDYDDTHDIEITGEFFGVSSAPSYADSICSTSMSLYEDFGGDSTHTDSVDNAFDITFIISVIQSIATAVGGSSVDDIGEAINILGDWVDFAQLYNEIANNEEAETHSIHYDDWVFSDSWYQVGVGVQGKCSGFLTGTGKSTISGQITEIEVEESYETHGGGGGCPYVSPWTGEKYARDNNLLIDSEYKEGVVEDRYVLEKGLEAKDGSYQLKVEEFENTENYFDQIGLYTIDHPEEYEVGTRPDGELVAYSEVGELSLADEEGYDLMDSSSKASYELEDIVDHEGYATKTEEERYLSIRAHQYESREEIQDMNHVKGVTPNAPPSYKSDLGLAVDSGNREIQLDIFEDAEIYPRNHESDILIPISSIQEELPATVDEEEAELALKSDSSLYLESVSLAVSSDDVKVREAEMEKAVFNGFRDVTSLLKNDSPIKLRQVPGDEIHMTFDKPREASEDGTERSYMIYSKGRYELFEGQGIFADSHGDDWSVVDGMSEDRTEEPVNLENGQNPDHDTFTGETEVAKYDYLVKPND